MKQLFRRLNLTAWRDGLNTAATVLVILVCLGLLIVMAPAIIGALKGTTATATAVAATNRPKPPIRPPNPPPTPLPAAPVSISGAISKGSADARVGILEYSDYQCPFCGVFARDTFPQLDKAYIEAGKVRFIYRDFPLETIHPNALPAAVTARCANEQGQFWPMQEVFFRNQKDLTATNFLRWARDLVLDVKRLDSCRAGDATSKVRQDLASGQTLGVTGTPTFFIGVIQADGALKVLWRFSGAKPLSDFQAALDPLVNAASQPAAK